MNDIRFKIAEAARIAGVSPSTLRLWESQGLIEPIRTESGQRLYDQPLVDRLKTIAWMRSEKGLNPAAIRESMEDRPVVPKAEPVRRRRREPAGIPVGRKVRRLRQAAGATLDAVAAECGISASVLSTFERTSHGLSFTALHAVAQHLGTTVAALSGQSLGAQGESLVRSGSWKSWPPTSSGVTVHVLAEGQNQMDCHRFQLAPGASSEGAYQHEGEEFIHVLTGRLEIILDGDHFFELSAGDSFYFESRRPHSWRNAADTETVLIWINTPPTF
jgi:DNA-binding transcriptional MerR regulator/quercetin dioxygenase-like cupin family protein